MYAVARVGRAGRRRRVTAHAASRASADGQLHTGTTISIRTYGARTLARRSDGARARSGRGRTRDRGRSARGHGRLARGRGEIARLAGIEVAPLHEERARAAHRGGALGVGAPEPLLERGEAVVVAAEQRLLVLAQLLHLAAHLHGSSRRDHGEITARSRRDHGETASREARLHLELLVGRQPDVRAW